MQLQHPLSPAGFAKQPGRLPNVQLGKPILLQRQRMAASTRLAASLHEDLAPLEFFTGAWSVAGGPFKGSMTAEPVLGGRWLQISARFPMAHGQEYAALQWLGYDASRCQTVRMRAANDGAYVLGYAQGWQGGVMTFESTTHNTDAAETPSRTTYVKQDADAWTIKEEIRKGDDWVTTVELMAQREA